MKYIRLICILSSVMTSAVAVHAESNSNGLRQPPSSICGHWKVTKSIPIMVAPKKYFLGLHAEYLTGVMRFGNTVAVSHPLYKVERWSEAKFFSGYHDVYLDQLGIKGNSVVVVEILNHQGKSVTDPGTILFVRNRNSIVTFWDGVFYVLTKEGLHG